MSDIEIHVARLAHGTGLPLPSYQSMLASGCDLFAAVPEDRPMEIAPGSWARIPTGLVLALPPGMEGQVRPRSGLAARSGVTVLNAPGTIDADYRGEVQVLLINFGRAPFAVKRGMRIAQLVVAKTLRATLIEAEQLGETVRSAGGFGSTGDL
jgi:dUTP diphosphatase